MAKLLLNVFVNSVLFFWYTYGMFYLFTLDVTAPNCPVFVKNAKERPWLFLTMWNFAFQYWWIFHDLIHKLLVKKHPHKNTMVEKSDFTRRLFFQSLVFPLTMTVFLYFWAVFLYDREIIYAKIVDEFIPSYLNLTCHLVILVPVFLEFYCTKLTLVDYKISFTILLLVSSTYTLMMFFWYFWNGEWIYKFYELGSWPLRTFYGALKVIIPTFCLAILYKMDTTKKYSEASVV